MRHQFTGLLTKTAMTQLIKPCDSLIVSNLPEIVTAGMEQSTGGPAASPPPTPAPARRVLQSRSVERARARARRRDRVRAPAKPAASRLRTECTRERMRP